MSLVDQGIKCSQPFYVFVSCLTSSTTPTNTNLELVFALVAVGVGVHADVHGLVVGPARKQLQPEDDGLFEVVGDGDEVSSFLRVRLHAGHDRELVRKPAGLEELVDVHRCVVEEEEGFILGIVVVF